MFIYLQSSKKKSSNIYEINASVQTDKKYKECKEGIWCKIDSVYEQYHVCLG